MSNTEPEGGTQNFFRSMFQRNTVINAAAGSEIKVAGLEDATRQMGALNSELAQLVTSLTGLSQQQAQLTQGISATMRTISSNAQQTASAVGGATEQMGRFRSGAMSIASVLGSAVNSNFVKDIAMFPLRYITSATEQARNLGMGVSTTLGSQMFATGQSQQSLMQQLARFPGGVQGGVEDIIGLQALGRQYGAMADLSTSAGQNNPRAVGFLQGVRELQQMSPGTPVAQLAQTIGSFSANVGAQQQAQYNTGGAFAMIGSGGHQKSVSEWAEGILRWLESQRPGDQKGKGFSYGELLAQQFPGSNIDAWLSQNGVPEGLKEYWWDYALNKSRLTGSTGAGATLPGGQAYSIKPVNTGQQGGGNQALGRLGAASAQARGQFGLGGQLSGMFANKETANQWFNEIIAQIMSDVIPKQIASGSLQAMGVMPDPIQELLMTFLERSGTIGAAVGGYLGYGPSISGISGITGLFQSLFAGGLPAGALGNAQETNLMLGGFGANPNAAGSFDLQSAMNMLPQQIQDMIPTNDVGDIGDVWTSKGTTGTAGLHPTMKRGIDRMIGDNPNIRVNSGLRDTVQQRRLKAQGHGTSGKPSAHTRGLAADLGPRSQYPWIVANAAKYGLKSGITHGEPWHVGLPGIGDIGDPVVRPAMTVTPTPPTTPASTLPPLPSSTNPVQGATSGDHPAPPPGDDPTVIPTNPTVGQVHIDANGVRWLWDGTHWNKDSYQTITTIPGVGSVFTPEETTAAATAAAGDDAPGLGNLFDLFKQGVTKDQAVSTIGSLVPTLLNLFLGAFNMGGGTEGLSSIAYDPNLYAALRAAATGPTGIITIGGTITNPYNVDYGNMGGGTVGSGGGGGESGPWGLMDSGGGDGVALPSGGGPGSEAAGIKAATALFNAGFRKRSDLETITAISWRESKWDPSVKNPNTSDRGLMQINMSAHKQTLNSLGYGESDLMDIQKNANVAYKLWQSGGGDYGSFQQLWGFSTHSPYVPGGVGWDKHGDPLGRTSGSHAAGIVAAAHLPTVGDVDALDTAAYSMDPTTYAPLAPVTGGEGRPIMFNNTFTINGGGGGSGNGIDMRRTVTMLADQLEGEMRQRLARSN